MAFINKSVLLEYSAEQMFALVDKVEDYPQFLPWCGGVEVNRDDGSDEVVAKVTMNFHGFQKSFTTRNINARPESITMGMVNGPFTKLDGTWTFKSLRPDACKIELNLEYSFSGHLLEAIIDPVFGAIAGSLVDSFCQRAKVVYG
jgi:ribosome-associated toxin RatA of RatAB toxin-antitoxin module